MLEPSQGAGGGLFHNTSVWTHLNCSLRKIGREESWLEAQGLVVLKGPWVCVCVQFILRTTKRGFVVVVEYLVEIKHYRAKPIIKKSRKQQWRIPPQNDMNNIK